MHNPAEFAVRQPQLVVLAVIFALGFGMLSYAQLPRQENPTLERRRASIRVYVPGADPETMERLVAKNLEAKLSELDDIDEIYTESTLGVTWATVDLRGDAHLHNRLEEVKDKVEDARVFFPVGARPPVVTTRLDTNAVIVTLESETSPLITIREHAEELERRLENLPGVSRVSISGAPKEKIVLEIDARALGQRGMSIPQIVEAIGSQNAELPGGELESGALRASIAVGGAFETIGGIAATYVRVLGREPIRLGEIAEITRHIADPEVIVRTNGQRAVALSVEMLSGWDTVALGQSIRAVINEYTELLPYDSVVNIVVDEPTYVRDRILLLIRNLLLGLALVVVLAILFLGWRMGLVVALPIPISVVAGLGLLNLSGQSLHQISLAALIIAVGLMIDESIIIADNTERHLDRGESAETAAISGLREVHLPVLGGAATTVAAFVPLMVLDGRIGDFVRSIPLTVSSMIIASVVVAHYVIPLLVVALYRNKPRRSAPSTTRDPFSPPYAELLRRFLLAPKLAFASFALVIIAIAVSLPLVLKPADFFHTADRHQFVIELRTPAGSRLEQTDAAVAQLEKILSDLPGVSNWTTWIGSGAPRFYYNESTLGQHENIAKLVVNVGPDVPFRRNAEIVRQVGARAASIVGADVRARELKQGFGVRPDLEILVEGDDLDQLRRLTFEVREAVSTVEGAIHVRDSFGVDPLVVTADINEAKANKLGIARSDVSTTLRALIDGVTATTVEEEDDEIDVVVRVQEKQRIGFQALGELRVPSRVTDELLPLSHVAELRPDWAVKRITRQNRKRHAAVEADVAERSVLAVTRDAEAIISRTVKVPPGYSIVFRGQRAEMTRSYLALANAGWVSVCVIYLILVLSLRSLLHPFLVVSILPLAAVGCVLGVAASGNALGFMALLGIISLIGIAVNDSILLISTIRRFRQEGLPLIDAVVRGSVQRIRPVLLTSATTIGGLLPLSLTGGSMWAPFGFAVIGGLVASTVITLGVQPTAYFALERWRSRKTAAAGDADDLGARSRSAAVNESRSSRERLQRVR